MQAKYINLHHHNNPLQWQACQCQSTSVEYIFLCEVITVVHRYCCLYYVNFTQQVLDYYSYRSFVSHGDNSMEWGQKKKKKKAKKSKVQVMFTSEAWVQSPATVSFVNSSSFWFPLKAYEYAAWHSLTICVLIGSFCLACVTFSHQTAKGQ